MPSISRTILSVLAASALVAAAPTAEKRGQPAGWATTYLESYSSYHVRYLALKCQDQHNTTFFDSCCHPLLATEDLSMRPSNCTPAATASSSASAVVATATAGGNGTKYDEYDVYCDEATSVAAAVSSYTATATASASAMTIVDSSNVTATIAILGEDLVSTTSTSTSEWVAPTTTSTTAPAWTPTSTSTSEAVATTTASSGGSGEVMTGGFATYFYQNGNPGACGDYSADSDKVIAIDTSGWWQNTGSASPYCGKWITITNTNNGKQVTAKVADACPSCVSSNSLDLSVGAFTAIASESDGMVPITWQWA